MTTHVARANHETLISPPIMETFCHNLGQRIFASISQTVHQHIAEHTLADHAGRWAVRILVVQVATIEKATSKPMGHIDVSRKSGKMIQVSCNCVRFPRPWILVYARDITPAQTTGISIQQCLHDLLRRICRAVTSPGL